MITVNSEIAQGETFYGDTRTPPTSSNYTGETLAMEGKTVFLPDLTVATAGTPATLRSPKKVKATIVRNVSNGDFTLRARRAAAWASGYRGKRVDSYAITYGEVAGIVDPHLANNANGGVRANDLFLLYDLSGPVEALTALAGDGTNVIAGGSFVAALTAATSQATTAGRVFAYDLTNTSTGTTDGTGALRLKFAKAQAMSAKTTANTNAAALIGIV